MRIKISADSTCDLSPELIETYNIGITPLYIEKGGQNCRDGMDITPQEIFDYVRSGKGVCRTAAVNVGDYTAFFKKCRENYDEVKDGKMGVGKKYRGKIDNCIAQYVRERLQGRDDLRRNRIFITHSGCAPEIVENVKAIIKECGGFDEVLETYAGCTVSSHCGPNTLGVLFVRK